ncbi:winged helix DNA-binding protein [Novosphingobium sp. Leaf2]|uniref:winged helix DNA-binding protein n=1 Tax=Novosphingobium sp. Leaf2 TaxID=1735670 RepID=UPI0006FDC880|nr:winged helix DNA-binding protein [Novosphingobium sp. Leaf2]KQM14754.1 transcriptional regulator [Novosphingobium sp. Leaf2]
MAGNADQDEQTKNLLLKSHLSPGEAEREFHEFEFALHHISEAFARWSSSVHEFVSGEYLAQPDVSVLQLIRMNEEPKSAADIGRYLNRDDSSNILYALRKLEKAGLIEKGDGPLRQTTYRVTDRGMELTDRYAKVRKDVLLNTLGTTFQGNEELSAAIKSMWRICGLYEQAARSISVMRVLQGDRQGELGERASSAKPASKRAAKVRGASAAKSKATARVPLTVERG